MTLIFLFCGTICFLMLCQSSKSIPLNPEILARIGQTLPGYQMVFASSRGYNNSGIWLVNVDGTREPNLNDTEPKWSHQRHIFQRRMTE